MSFGLPPLDIPLLFGLVKSKVPWIPFPIFWFIKEPFLGLFIVACDLIPGPMAFYKVTMFELDWFCLGIKVFWFNLTLFVLWFYLASISSELNLSALLLFLLLWFPSPSFFISFTLSAYLKVFKVCSTHELAGLIFAIIVVLLSPVNESFKTWVSLLPLNGRCFFSRSSALMHSLRANRLLLISAPSSLVYLFWSIVSAPRSLPAKSMKLILECTTLFFLFLSSIYRMACDLELSSLAPVTPLVLTSSPLPITCMICYTLSTGVSVSPIILTFYLASSRHFTSSLFCNKSKSLPQ